MTTSLPLLTSAPLPDDPLVSIVMPAHNEGPRLAHAIESVLNQTYQNWELLLLDDGSQDDTWSIMTSYDDPRINRSQSTKNLGRGEASNQCIDRATGIYIAIFDADDVSLPERLEEQVGYLESTPSISVLASQLIYIGPDGQESDGYTFPSDALNIAKRFAKGQMGIPNASAIFRYKLLEQYGRYAKEMMSAHDFEWYLRMASTEQFEVLPKPLVRYQIKDTAISLKSWTTSQSYRRYGIYRATRSIKDESILTFTQYQRNSLLKHRLHRVEDVIKYSVWRSRKALQPS